jgi:HEAT repeat protein
MSKNKEENMSVAEVIGALAESEFVSVPILYRLSDLFGEELETFRSGWGTLEAERRRQVMRHLSDLTEENYLVQFDNVFQIGIEDEFAPVRVAAVDGLWLSEDVRFVQPLIELMEGDVEVEVRASATAALGQYLLNAVCEIIPSRFEGVILPALFRQLHSPDTHPTVFQRALESASQSGDPALEAMISDAYESEDIETQVAAVRSMGIMGRERWLHTIIEEMESRNADMRVAAANAASNLDKQEAVPGLIELTDDTELDVQIAAIYALGSIGGDVAARVLQEILNDEDREDLHEAADEAFEELSAFAEGLEEFMLMDADEDDDDEDYDELNSLGYGGWGDDLEG